MQQQSRIIWFAIVVSTFIYAFMAYMMTNGRAHASFEDELRTPLVMGLYAAALGGFLAATAFSIIARDRPPQLRMIVSLALYESCAIFGLIAAFLASDWRLFLAPWALSLIGFFRLWPSTEPT